MSGPWARLGGVALVPTTAEALQTPGLQRALADGIERGFEGALPAFPPGADTYLLRAASEDVGLLALKRDCPAPGAASVLALAVDPECRGSSVAARALLAAERRLQRDGAGRLLARVPRTNGRGLYFMLRVGFTPITDPPADGATWFARGGSR